MFVQEEEGEGNPRMVYKRELPHWATQTRVPVEIVGHTPGELARGLITMENSLNYGQKARVQLLTRELPTQSDLNTLYSRMVVRGFHTTKPVPRIMDGVPATEMVIQKGSPVWAALIPLIPTAIIGGLIVFGITRIEAITKALLPIILVTIGGVVILAAVLTRGPVLKAAERYLPRTIPVAPKKALAASFA